MSERDKWIYELGQRHPNVLFEVSEAYIVERRGKDKDEIAKLKALLTETAGVAHHGALLGYTSEAEATRQVRILTLPHWDKDECTRLQSERRRNE